MKRKQISFVIWTPTREQLRTSSITAISASPRSPPSQHLLDHRHLSISLITAMDIDINNNGNARMTKGLYVPTLGLDVEYNWEEGKLSIELIDDYERFHIVETETRTMSMEDVYDFSLAFLRNYEVITVTSIMNGQSMHAVTMEYFQPGEVHTVIDDWTIAWDTEARLRPIWPSQAWSWLAELPQLT